MPFTKKSLAKLLVICLLTLFVFSISSCADDSDIISNREYTREAQTETAIAQPGSPSGNYSGAANITVYYGGPYGGEPCLREGTVTLIIKDNGEVVLTALGPDISPPNCTASGDQHEYHVYGKFKNNTLYFNKCDTEKTTESTAVYTFLLGKSTITGTIDCSLDQSRALKIEFTANKK